MATAFVPVVSLALLLSQQAKIFSGQVLILQCKWLPSLGFNLSLRLDGLGFLFALLVLGIGILVIIYARYYLAKKEPMGRFFAFLLLFMGSMLGVVLSENLLLMVVFWELTSLSSFLLISYWNYRGDARKGARMALAVTGAGGLALFAGIILLGNIVGSFELSQVLASGDVIRASSMYPLVLVCILLGVFTKSAQLPFHFWLPHAMAAPTPVSSYLHSATMVKAGVFLLARLYPALSGTDLWFYLVAFTGLITMFIGAAMALFQHDLKGLLAYSTISHLGLITLLFGLDTRLGAIAGIFHIINHATFKASLFMAAGIIEHETGSRDMRLINGMWRYMPHTAVLAMVAASAMAGVPLLNGFLSKEMLFSETVNQNQLGSFNWIIPSVAALAAVFSVAYSLRFIHDVFFNGEPVSLPKYPPHEPPRYMKVPVEILVFICLLVGIAPAYTVAPLLKVASSAALGGVLPEYSLAIWHGFNIPLFMSFIALSMGVLIYSFRKPLFHWYAGLPSMDAKHLFDKGVTVFFSGCRQIIDILDNRSLQRYLVFVLVSVLVVVIISLIKLPQLRGSVTLSEIDVITALGLVIMMIASVITLFFQQKRIISVLMLSIVGLMIALFFARYSAPDLALTQLSVEIMTIVLLMLALFFLPSYTPVESNSLRALRDVLLSIGCGSILAMLTFAVLTRPYSSISNFFISNSLSGAGGKNLVNVILVDFRGFDTLGEISVLAIAGIGIYAMLDKLTLLKASIDDEGHSWAQDKYPLILATLSRLLLPVALLISIFIFFRGHNLPGGGFIAGLITASALILQYIANGVQWTQLRLPVNYHVLTGLGVFLAGVTGIGSWFFSQPFLTSTFGHFSIPFIGNIELASVMLFDAGVYLTVVGATLLILSSLGKLAQNEHNMETL
ncbi:UNVERIFIED_CONTAM: hypothetical protein GTU68_005037 [Idotea baltica]|nr:hypothetical protein [Idotea baltica]